MRLVPSTYLSRPGIRTRIAGAVFALCLLGVTIGSATPALAAARYPNDPYFARQWFLPRIGAPTAWKTTKGKGVTIAIVDTGVARRHEDLRANMSPYQDDEIDHKTNTGDSCRPICHGTAVAGTAAAVTNNKLGVAGVAPQAKIMAVRVFRDVGTATSTDVANGVKWAVEHGANVINLSLGTSIPVVDIDDAAVAYATARGALVVASAGNASSPFCASPALDPAALCVGATDSMDRLTSFSNYALRLDVVAPGQGIWTTEAITPYDNLGFYGALSGTSFAAPIVSGVGALLMSMGATNVQAAAIIRATAKRLGSPPVYNLTYGFGRVDAAAAVDLCKQVCAGGPSLVPAPLPVTPAFPDLPIP